MNTRQTADHRFVALAQEMLAGLRSRKLAQLKRMTRGDIDLSKLAEMETTPLSVEQAAHAVRLAHCLSPHFASIAELVGSKAFILIETGAATPSVVVADVLGDSVLQVAGRVATNPVHGIEHEENFLVLYSSDPRPSSSASIALAEAARRGLTAVCLVEHLTFAPASILSGADLTLTLPPYDQTSLELIFQAGLAVDEPGLISLADVEWLQTDDLVAHIRPGRTPSECLDKIAAAISARRPQPVSARSHSNTPLDMAKRAPGVLSWRKIWNFGVRASCPGRRSIIAPSSCMARLEPGRRASPAYLPAPLRFP